MARLENASLAEVVDTFAEARQNDLVNLAEEASGSGFRGRSPMCYGPPGGASSHQACVKRGLYTYLCNFSGRPPSQDARRGVGFHGG